MLDAIAVLLALDAEASADYILLEAYQLLYEYFAERILDSQRAIVLPVPRDTSERLWLYERPLAHLRVIE